MAPRWLLPLSALLHALPAASLAVEPARSSAASSFVAGLPALLSNAGECDLCAGRQQWLFLLSTNQSGRTSLLEMLNAVPGFYIAGENLGIMDVLQEEYESLGKIVKRSERGEPGWQSKPISQRHVLCSLQAVVRAAIGEFREAETSFIGFRETRHTSRHQLDFFRKVFPCARFVLSSGRELALSTGQGQHSQQQQQPSSSPAAEEFALWRASHPEDSFAVGPEGLSAERAGELLSWLGVEGCHVSEDGHAGAARLKLTGAACRAAPRRSA